MKSELLGYDNPLGNYDGPIVPVGLAAMKFELLGHDNPLGSYPGPIVPVGVFEGKLVAIYTAAIGEPYVAAATGNKFVRHDAKLAWALKGFDYINNRLFAHSEQEVQIYDITDEIGFFGNLLKDSAFCADKPFVRYSLSKAIFDAEIMRNELYGCIASLVGYADRDFIDQWYTNERAALLQKLDSSAAMYFPETWRVLLRTEQERKPSIFLPHPAFFGQGQSHGISGTGYAAGMSAALVAVATFSNRSGAEHAYRLLLDRKYSPADVNLLLLRATFELMFPELAQTASNALTHIDSGSLTYVLKDRQYADLGTETLVCAGPFAAKLAGITGTSVDLHQGLTASGLAQDLAKIYEKRLLGGAILMGVTSIPASDVSFFERYWLEA